MGEGPELIAIFPLQQVVLFPGVRTSLHLFEPRYRQMAEQVLDGDRRIAMVTVKPECLHEMEGDPEVFDIGCAGIITQAERLPDGRHNIVLQGSHRVRILAEPERAEGQLYRTARVERLEDRYEAGDAQHVVLLRARVIELVGEMVNESESGKLRSVSPEMFEKVDDATLVNALANGLPFGPREKQSLLEANAISERFERLADVLSFLQAERSCPTTQNPGAVH